MTSGSHAKTFLIISIWMAECMASANGWETDSQAIWNRTAIQINGWRTFLKDEVEWLNGQRKLFPGHPKAKLSHQGPALYWQPAIIFIITLTTYTSQNNQKPREFFCLNLLLLSDESLLLTFRNCYLLILAFRNPQWWIWGQADWSITASVSFGTTSKQNAPTAVVGASQPGC